MVKLKQHPKGTYLVFTNNYDKENTKILIILIIIKINKIEIKMFLAALSTNNNNNNNTKMLGFD